MYTAVFLLSLLLAVLGDMPSEDLPLLGAKKCTWGPSYWCDSLENAKECGGGSEQHCREKVWIGDHPLADKLTKPIPEEAVENFKANCALCELIGNKIFEKLTNNATEEEVIEEMELVCDILPSSYKDTCMEYVEEYGKIFYEAFVETADVHEICVMLGLCSAEFMRIVETTQLLPALMSGGVQDIPCDACQSLTALVQKEVLANEADIEALLDEVCAILPVDQKECDEAVNQMFDAAVQFFENYTPLELCQLAGVCENNLADSVFGVGPVEFGQEGQRVENNMVF